MNISTYKSIMKNNPDMSTLSLYDRAKALHLSITSLRKLEEPGWKPVHEQLMALEKRCLRYERIIDETIDTPKNYDVSYDQNLENCTDAELSALEGGLLMAYKRVRVYIGDDASGKPMYTQVSGKNQDECNNNIVKAFVNCGRISEFVTLAQATPHSISQDVHHPFTPYAQECHKRYKGSLRGTTAVTQKGWLDELCAFFEHEAVENITVDRVQDYINSIQKNTTGVIGQKVTFLGEILAAAYEDGFIPRNPTESKRTKLGGVEGKGIKALTKEEIKKLIEKINLATNEQVKLWLALMLYAGLRREELLGLRWEDIDFTKGFLHIERAVTYPSSKPVVGAPKTKKSDRHVAMPDELIKILAQHRKPEGYIIADEKGQLLNEYNVKKLRKAVRLYSELPELDARQLRHSYASMLHAAGIERKAIGVSMGHTNFDTTDGYIDVEQSRLKAIRNAGIEYVLS